MAVGPSPEVREHLPGWKAQYGEVLYQRYGDIELVFRTIGLDHYERLELAHHLKNPVFTDDIVGEVLQECLLWPEGFDLEDMPQSDFIELNERLRKMSPFGDIEALAEVIHRYRERYSNPVTLLAAFICAAFPSKSLEDVKRWTSHQMLQNLVVAEHILQREFPLPDSGAAVAPKQLSPDEVRVAKASAAVQRREQAIARAKRNRDLRRAEAGYGPNDPQPNPEPPKPRQPRRASAVPEGAGPMTEAVPGGPKRRQFSARDILKKSDQPIDFDSESEMLGDLWGSPDG